MHISRVDLNLFVVLDAIYSEGNITRASRKLNLTQPAISHALARLRQLFNDPLFVRQGAAMSPTPFTRNIIAQVRQALSLFESSMAGQVEFDPGNSHRLFHLGLRDVFEATALPPLLARLRQLAPQIEIASVRIDRRDIESELASGNLDLALDIPVPVGDQIRQQRVSRDRLIVLARAGHPAINGGLDLPTYLAQAHVLVSSRRKGMGLEDFELNREGYRRSIGLRCQHYFAACRVVSETDLLLTMPEQYARIANAQFGNVIHDFPAQTQPLAAHLYWHASADDNPANRWLRQQLSSLFGPQS